MLSNCIFLNNSYEIHQEYQEVLYQSEQPSHQRIEGRADGADERGREHRQHKSHHAHREEVRHQRHIGIVGLDGHVAEEACLD